MVSKERLEEIAYGDDWYPPEVKAAIIELLAWRKAAEEPVAWITYKGYLIHDGDPNLAQYSDPTPLIMKPDLTGGDDADH